MDRLKERGPLVLGKFADQYPVLETLKAQLENHIKVEFDIDPDILKDWPYEKLTEAALLWTDRLKRKL